MDVDTQLFSSMQVFFFISYLSKNWENPHNCNEGCNCLWGEAYDLGGRRSTAEQVRARPDEHNQEKTQSFHLEAAFVKKEKKEKSVINFKSWSIEQLEETFIFNSRKKRETNSRFILSVLLSLQYLGQNGSVQWRRQVTQFLYGKDPTRVWRETVDAALQATAESEFLTRPTGLSLHYWHELLSSWRLSS